VIQCSVDHDAGEQLMGFGGAIALLRYAVWTMNVLHFSDLGEDIRASLQGQRWLVLDASQLNEATAALAFSELEDVLVAVDHRSAALTLGLWVRAVHLLVVDESLEIERLQRESGITKVVASAQPIEELLW
jgi:hypothetical protein